MVINKRHRFLIVIVILSSLSILNLSNIQQVNADYLVKPRYAYTFFLETLDTPGGTNHFINYGNLFIYEGATLEVKFLEVYPIIEFRLTIDLNFQEGIHILNNLLVQEDDWDALTSEYQGLGYEIVETNSTWGVRQNDTAILNANYSKRDGVLLDFYANNQTDFINYLNIGEIYIYRTGASYGNNWLYSFLAIIPIGGFIIGLVVYKRKVASKEKLLEAT